MDKKEFIGKMILMSRKYKIKMKLNEFGLPTLYFDDDKFYLKACPFFAVAECYDTNFGRMYYDEIKDIGLDSENQLCIVV